MTEVEEKSHTPVEMDESGDKSESDSEDEDFVPTEGAAGSEEDSNDCVSEGEDDSKTESGKKSHSSMKRKRTKSKNSVSKRRRMTNTDSGGDDEINFFEKDSRRARAMRTRDSENNDSVEEISKAEEEAAEKAHTDKLWEDFLTDVNELKTKRRKEKPATMTVDKVVNKVYNFAGETVSIQQKVQMTLPSSSASGKERSNDDGSSKGIIKDNSKNCQQEIPQNNTTPGTGASTSSPEAGPSSAATSPRDEVRPRRGGISILGNDPGAIGLDELDKRGLSGLLKAFQSKSNKIGTLEKSKLDWDVYKRQQGLEEELDHHNRSRDTFIDKQEFLQRTDYRQFEIERNMRATVRSRRLAN